MHTRAPALAVKVKLTTCLMQLLGPMFRPLGAADVDGGREREPPPLSLGVDRTTENCPELPDRMKN